MVYNNPFRNLTVGNFMFIIAMGLIFLPFGISYLLNQFVDTPIIKTGNIFNLLIFIVVFVIIFYTAIKKQGGFERSDILLIVILIATAAGSIYYLPQLFPALFSALPTQSITQSSPIAANFYQNSIGVMSDGATQLHDLIQAFVPIP